MKSIDVLRGEHAMILVVLDELDKIVRRIETGGPLPKRVVMESALGFCRRFADRFHHYKEEYVMFTMLAQRHDGALDLEIEKHRSEHEQLRDHLSALSDALPAFLAGSTTAASETGTILNDYVTTLRRHIRSENERFFPLVEQAISADDDRRLLDEFVRYEGLTGREIREAYRQQIAMICEAN